MSFNGTMIQYFEWNLPPGMLWKQLKSEAGALRDAGFTAVWIPPCYKGSEGINDAGYAPYDLYDLGEFDQKGTVPTKYGTKDELLEAIDEVHRCGMQVYADVVLDHKLGADKTELVEAEEVNPDNRYETQSGPRQISAWTHFTFPGRKGKYSDFEWHWYHFVGTDWDDKTGTEAIFRFRGKHWHKVDRENGNFDYLMGADIDLSNREVDDELLRWGKWFVHTTGVDGFRLDAVKHMKFSFYNEWLDAMRTEMNHEFFSVGEYWNGDIRALRNYVDTTEGALSLFDVALHFRFTDASHYQSFDLRDIFHDTLTQDNPLKSVTFVDNHDTQPGESLSSWVKDWFKPLAYALILLRQEGYPCVFYGDWYGLKQDGIPDKRDMLARLMKARGERAFGAQTDYFDDPRVVGWTRGGDEEHPDSGLAALISNDTNESKKWMKVGEKFAGNAFYDITGNRAEEIVIEDDGGAKFAVNARSVSVWVKK